MSHWKAASAGKSAVSELDAALSGELPDKDARRRDNEKVAKYADGAFSWVDAQAHLEQMGKALQELDILYDRRLLPADYEEQYWAAKNRQKQLQQVKAPDKPFDQFLTEDTETMEMNNVDLRERAKSDYQRIIQRKTENLKERAKIQLLVRVAELTDFKNPTKDSFDTSKGRIYEILSGMNEWTHFANDNIAWAMTELAKMNTSQSISALKSLRVDDRSYTSDNRNLFQLRASLLSLEAKPK